jgi:hypothetical protein
LFVIFGDGDVAKIAGATDLISSGVYIIVNYFLCFCVFVYENSFFYSSELKVGLPPKFRS